LRRTTLQIDATTGLTEVGRPLLPRRLRYTLPHTTPSVTGGPHPMTSADRAIVQRTWGLLQQARSTSPNAARLAYGPHFTYDEFLVINSFSVLSSLGLTVGLVIGALLMNTFSSVSDPSWFIHQESHQKQPRTPSQLRGLLKHVVPQPGEGPPDKLRTLHFSFAVFKSADDLLYTWCGTQNTARILRVYKCLFIGYRAWRNAYACANCPAWKGGTGAASHSKSVSFRLPQCD